MAMSDTQLGFVVEWWDAQASLTREYVLTYFVRADGSNEISLFDVKLHRPFLKRTPYPSVRIEDLYIGATINIYARQLAIRDYANDSTRGQIEQKRQLAVALIRPQAYTAIGECLEAAESAGLTLCRLRMIEWNDAEGESKGFSGGPTLAVELAGENLESKWQSLSSKLPAGATTLSDRGMDYFLDNRRFPSTASFTHCTLCIIKPHAVKGRTAGAIIRAIQAQGFEISAARSLHFERATAQELLEVYQGVVRDYSRMVDELVSSPCIALEVRAEDAVSSFRELCGPMDVELAQRVRPRTLRALHGVDRVRCGVHCTDLPEDGVLECQYVFHLLQ